MVQPLYPDQLIDRALREADPIGQIGRARVRRARAEMIYQRDSAGPRAGLEPTPGDLALALRLRAADLLGISPPGGFYLNPEERKGG